MDTFVVVIDFTFNENSWHIRVGGATPEANMSQGVVSHTDKNIVALRRHMTNTVQHSPLATKEPILVDVCDEMCFFFRRRGLDFVEE